MYITVTGIGYVGASLALLLAQKHKVVAVDKSAERLELIKNHKAPFANKDIDKFFAERNLKIEVSEDPAEDYRLSDYILIATPTDFDEK